MDKKDVPMSQQESIAPRQASRFVTAEMRQAMVGERARMLGRKQTPPTALEVAAAQWGKTQEARAKEVAEETLRLSHVTEMPPFSLQRVALRAEALPPADEAFGKAYIPPQPQRKRATRQGRIGGIAVGSLATRMIQQERAGGSMVVTDPRSSALEAAARRWAEQRTRRDLGR